MNWRDIPEASELLADCGRNPPPKRVMTYRWGETATFYVGRRAAALRFYYIDAEPPIDTPEWREWLELTPQVAIGEAIKEQQSQGVAPLRAAVLRPSGLSPYGSQAKPAPTNARKAG